MLEKLFEEFKAPSHLDFVKRFHISKEDWEHTKKELLKEFEEVDKYFEEKEKKPILTDVEREYLRAVIKPFRKKIENIAKYENNSSNEFIRIYLKNNDTMCFPNFPSGTKYKGMKTGKQYTLEELGL